MCIKYHSNASEEDGILLSRKKNSNMVFLYVSYGSLLFK